MFNLEQSIVEWRREMLAAGVKNPSVLDELEGHLREEVQRQVQLGASAEQSFEVAVGRMGPASSLKTEFKKLFDTAKARRQTRIAGAMYAIILSVCSLYFACILFENDLAFRERLWGLASVATMLSSAHLVWRIVPRFIPAFANKTVQSAVGIIGGGSGAGWFLAFAYLILPHCDFTQGQLMVAVSWAFIPALLLPQAAFLMIDEAERQRPTPMHS